MPPPAPAVAAAQEATLWTGHPSKLNYIGGWFFGILFTLFGSIALAAGLGTPGAAIAASGLLLILWISVARWKRLYMVTDRRVTIKTGIFFTNRRELRIKDIRSINVARRGLSGLFFRLGTVEFSSAARDDADVIFNGIRNADAIRQIVSGCQD